MSMKETKRAPVTLAAERATRAIASMTPALKRAYLSIGRRLADGRLHDLASRYDVGRRVAEILHNERPYGTGAIRRLADAFGRREDFFYDAARVASCWSRDEFDDVVASPTMDRLPLSFSHFTVIARVDDKLRRAELLRLCAERGLSVGKLRALVRAPSSADRLAASLERNRRQVAALLSTVGPLRAEIGESDPVVQQDDIRRTLDAYRALRAEVDATVRVLETAVVPSGVPALAPPPARTGRAPGVAALWGGGGR
jgi:hypothetical protein